MRTPDEIYEEIRELKTPVGPGDDNAERIAYWEAVMVVQKRREELWMELAEVLSALRPHPPLWQVAAARGAADGWFERWLNSRERAADLRTRMAGDQLNVT